MAEKADVPDAMYANGSKGDKASEDTHEEARVKLSAPEKPEDMRAPSSIRFPSCRFVLTMMAFFGMINCYTLRVNLSMAIVAMVNGTYLHEIEKSASDNYTVSHEDVCYPPDANKTKNETTTGSFNWDEQTQGIILGGFFYGYTTTQVLGGTLAQRIGGKVLMLFGIAWTAALTLLLPILTELGGFGAIFALRLLMGMGEAVTYPAMVSMLSHWAPPLERSRMTTFMHAGGQMGTVLGMPISGFLCQIWGWESVFYFFGVVGLVWSVMWWFLVYDTPARHPRISIEEREYIEKALATRKDAKRTLHVPWLQIFKCVPLYALAVAHFTCNIGYYTLLTTLPTYFGNILAFDMKSNGLVSGAPYLFMWMFLVGSGWLADMARARNLMSTTNIRKLMNGVGFVIPAILLIATGFTCNAALAVFLIIVAVAFLGISFAGWSVNHLDLAPPYAGTLMGLTNTFATLPGFIGPAVVGAITYRNQTLTAWRTCFYIGGAVFAFGTIIYSIFGSGEVQPWAVPKKQEEMQAFSDTDKEKEKDRDVEKDLKEV